MPKNTVTDPITDQEIAFARLIMSGTMNDRRAAEAVGLNPETAAYTKAKPRVRTYMLEHRAAVNEKLVDQEADGLRRLNLGRDQILTRLWELATLSHEATRGTIAGQIKALSMIVAIEGMVPGRRSSSFATQPAAPPLEPGIHNPDWLRKQQHESASDEPGDPVAATKTTPAASQPAPPVPPVPACRGARSGVPNPEPKAEPSPKSANSWSFPDFDPNPAGTLNPFIKPQAENRVPTETSLIYDAVLQTGEPDQVVLLPKRTAALKP